MWMAQAISTTGDWLIVGLVIDLASKLSRGSSSAVGGLMSVKILPALILGGLIGVLVDRYDRRRAMIVSDLARAALVLALLFVRDLWQVYVLVFLGEAFALVFIPAKNATVPNIVSEDELAEANSLTYTTDQVAMFLGLNFGAAFLVAFDALMGRLNVESIPVLGPYAPMLIGAHAGLTLDAISFTVSALLIAGVAISRPAERHREPLSLFLIGRDVVEGLRFLKGNPALRSTMLGVAAATLGIGTVYTAGFAVSSDTLGYESGAAGFTALIGVFALGMLVGALLSGTVGRRFGYRNALIGGLGVFGVGLIGFALAPNRLFAVVAAVVSGVGMAILYVNGWTYLQREAHDGIRGRVFVTFETLLRVSLLVSLTLSGAAVDVLRNLMGRARLGIGAISGPTATLLFGAAIILVSAVAMAVAGRGRSIGEQA